MDLKFVKSPILHDAAFARRLFFRIFLFASAVSLIPILHILTSYDFKSFHLPKSPPCYAAVHGGANPRQLPRGSYLFQGHFLNPVWDSFDSVHCQENVNLTVAVVGKLVDEKHLFNHTARALYVGGSSSSAVSALQDLGFSGVIGVDSGRVSSLGYKLDFPNGSFDFVLFRGKFKVSVPDLVVGEIERVLDRGGVGVVVFGVFSSPGAAEISIGLAGRVGKLVRSSCIVDSGYVNNFYMIVFKKKQVDDLSAKLECK